MKFIYIYEEILRCHPNPIIPFFLVPPSTPQILVQQRVNTYQISLRGSEDDSFGAPKLDDHYSNQEYNSNNIVHSNGWQGSYKNKTPSKDIWHIYWYIIWYINVQNLPTTKFLHTV